MAKRRPPKSDEAVEVAETAVIVPDGIRFSENDSTHERRLRVLHLREIEGRSFREIADALNVSGPTAWHDWNAIESMLGSVTPADLEVERGRALRQSDAIIGRAIRYFDQTADLEGLKVALAAVASRAAIAGIRPASEVTADGGPTGGLAVLAEKVKALAKSNGKPSKARK